MHKYVAISRFFMHALSGFTHYYTEGQERIYAKKLFIVRSSFVHQNTSEELVLHEMHENIYFFSFVAYLLNFSKFWIFLDGNFIRNLSLSRIACLLDYTNIVKNIFHPSNIRTSLEFSLGISHKLQPCSTGCQCK